MRIYSIISIVYFELIVIVVEILNLYRRKINTKLLSILNETNSEDNEIEFERVLEKRIDQNEKPEYLIK